MPANYDIDARARLACICAWGEVTADELGAVYTKCLTDERWQPTYAVLWDTRRVDVLDLQPEASAQLLRTVVGLRDKMGPGRSAVVPRGASDLQRSRTFLRSFGLLGGVDKHREMEAFRTIESAVRWLGVSGTSPLAAPDRPCC